MNLKIMAGNAWREKAKTTPQFHHTRIIQIPWTLTSLSRSQTLDALEQVYSYVTLFQSKEPIQFMLIA